jgi:DNA excision repair protein ERCC-2
MIMKETLYERIEEIVEDLLEISETIREKTMKAGDFRESAIERVTDFLYRIYRSSADPAYLTVYRKDDEGVALEVRNIDPGARIRDVCRSHAACIMISGTLSPVESFRRYYFGDEPAQTLSLPNAFPRDHRLVICANDVTTAYSMRQDQKNNTRIQQYIEAFAAGGGNRAVYFPSYQILDSFAARCNHTLQRRRIFIEPRDAAAANVALKEFISLPGQGKSGVIFAVCGGKWSEGLDYRGEMLSGAMVVGLPLAPYNRVRQMVIMYFRNKFGDEGEFISYTLPAINRALQALGRVIRTPEDRGVLVLAEKRFLEPRIKETLPAWMREEMHEGTADTFRGALSRWKY